MTTTGTSRPSGVAVNVAHQRERVRHGRAAVERDLRPPPGAPDRRRADRRTAARARSRPRPRRRRRASRRRARRAIRDSPRSETARGPRAPRHAGPAAVDSSGEIACVVTRSVAQRIARQAAADRGSPPRFARKACPSRRSRVRSVAVVPVAVLQRRAHVAVLDADQRVARRTPVERRRSAGRSPCRCRCRRMPGSCARRRRRAGRRGSTCGSRGSR